jgi:hypothetical protein
VSAETSLELVPGDGVDVCMGVAVHLPPVGCCPIELVCSKKDLLTISTLGQSSASMGFWLVRKWWGEFVGTLPNGTGVVVEVGVLLLVGLHAVEGLQHGLHQLSLGGE